MKTADLPDQKAAEEDEPSNYTMWLLRMKRLPPLSPEGSQFEFNIRQGNFNHADVVGENFSQYLQDGMPGLEEVFGEEEANSYRRKIEVFRRGDYKELHDMLLPGGIWDPPDQWAVGETDTSRYPMAICTSGAVTMEKLLRDIRGLVKSSTTEVNKITTPSSEGARVREQMTCSSDSGDESSSYLSSSDMDDDSLQYSDYESDEEQGDSGLKEKSLAELFPDQRFRDDI